jgi:Trk K+ transport system NAD-binding subunit
MKIIIIGAGEVGFHIAQRLSEENQDVVLIEKDPKPFWAQAPIHRHCMRLASRKVT